MGAHTFSLKINAKSDEQFKTKFHAAAEEDRHENGRGTYSGTIGQKTDYILLPSCYPREIRSLQEKNDGNKWGPAMAAGIFEVKKFGKSRTVSYTMFALSGNATRMEYKAMFKDGEEIEITSVEVIREAEYKLKKVDDRTGWKVTSYGDTFWGTKKECLKEYKARLLEGRACNMVQQAQVYERVCSSLAKFKVTGKVTRVRPTGKISHYQVWGWAAD